MRNLDLSRCVLSICVAAVLAACGQWQPTVNAKGAGSVTGVYSLGRATSSYQLLYSFHRSHDDGMVPWSSLTYLNGDFYGTTIFGGSERCRVARNFHGCGTLFSLDSQEKVRFVYSFGPGTEGFHSLAGVTELNGTLYGTLNSGGPACHINRNCVRYGVIYSISPSGSNYRVAHAFSGPDGFSPNSDLVAYHGTLYGTTQYGGNLSDCEPSADFGCGTVFSIAPSGALKTLYAFTGGADGAFPTGVVVLGGTLYGTTTEGGNYNCSGAGCGTIFSLTTSGAKKTLYKFQAGRDGNDPNALTAYNGMLYGTTLGGGLNGSSGYAGTVFSVSTSANYHILYRFKGGLGDGAEPNTPLVTKGKLYGTTSLGGTYSCGTVFRVTLSGSESILHVFQGSPTDGCFPATALTSRNETLYGMTPSGGARNHGSIFSLTP